ncbi:MAG: 50S ribosomal protein L21 [Phycisphaerales bacterium]|jgi:large subunit ribosomal protein L21
MYAIIEESGSQRKVQQGEEILVDLIEEGAAAAGKSVSFDKILVVGEVGGAAKIGMPYVSGASVTCEIVEPVVQGEKLYIQRFREKKAWQRRTGHRQKYTKVRITAIKG